MTMAISSQKHICCQLLLMYLLVGVQKHIFCQLLLVYLRMYQGFQIAVPDWENEVWS